MNRPRTFLVTGSAGGIGRRLTERLVADGHRVVATDIAFEGLSALAADHDWPRDRTSIERLDVTDLAAWTELVATVEAELGSIDVLVNVAGYLMPGWAHETEERDIHRHFDVNVKGVVFGTRAVTPGMVTRGRGHVINVASLAALAPIPGLSLYSASKYAVRGFSLAAAQELSEHGVFVSVVCPDAVATPMLDLQKNYEEAALTFSGRVLSADEVCDAILGPVLRRAPLEFFLPSSRGWLARLADMFPATARTLDPVLRRRGRARQKKLRAAK